MGKITLLNELNAIGEELGYPFYLFADGSYGNKFVNGKMNAVAVIKKPFKQTELHDTPARAKETVCRADYRAKTSALSSVTARINAALPPTYHERIAALSEEDRKKLQKALLLVRDNKLCFFGESCLLLRYAQKDDVQKCLQLKTVVAREGFLCLLENSLLSTEFLKQCITDREEEIVELIEYKEDWNKNYFGFYFVQKLRPDMLLWFMNKFHGCFGICSREISFIQRCVQLNDFSMLTEYIRVYNSFMDREVTDYLVEEALNNSELYKWYTDVYLKRAQKSA